MFESICAFIVMYVLISILWPDPRKKQREDDRRHAEMLAAITDIARRDAAPTAPPAPKYDAADRAHVIAQGRIRDRENGLKRHPFLDSAYTNVANSGHNQPASVPILQAGVVDGMPYTLYTDGSIEAQLPQGMLRFGSLIELRNYVEKNA
jgi:hypothetical protein